MGVVLSADQAIGEGAAPPGWCQYLATKKTSQIGLDVRRLWRIHSLEVETAQQIGILACS
jgi:23S rRNA U2552 (ribose-2'-O)-methylase RlmE/FtsJ